MKFQSASCELGDSQTPKYCGELGLRSMQQANATIFDEARVENSN